MSNINELANYRYLITITPNDRNTYKLPTIAGLGTRQNVTMATTYKNLIDYHLKSLEQKSNSSSFEQVKRNHLTALRSFISYTGQSDTSPVGLEMTADFAQSLKSHLFASKISVRSQTDRKCLLNSWRESYLTMNAEPILRIGRERRRATETPIEQNPFEMLLWNSLKASKLSPKTAARLAGISTSAIGRWSRGALPNARTSESLYKLDSVLDLSKGTLLASFQQATGKSSNTPTNEYRNRQKINTSMRFCIGIDDIRPALLNEWKAHLTFKTAAHTGHLTRGNSGRWSLVEERNSAIKPSAFTSVGKCVSPSASILWTRTSSFLGVWAAETFGTRRKIFDLSESPRSDYFRYAKG